MASEEPLSALQTLLRDEDVATPPKDEATPSFAADPIAYLVPNHRS
jgi:hypothetical protein